jgi:protein arginine kinase activator
MRVCESCRRDVATLHVAGAALCVSCAREVESEFTDGAFSVIAVFSGAPVRSSTPDACEFCGSTYDEIQDGGLLGCWRCYDAFRDRLAIGTALD